MKIIISPSKTQKPDYNSKFKDKEIIYLKEHKKILAALRKLNKSKIANIMKLKGDLLDSTYKNIKNYNLNNSFQSFFSFDGLVFKNLQKDTYKDDDLLYIENNVRILDAFYGVLEPGTKIKPYRLDMKMNIGLNLYKHWDVNSYFKDELIINLASDEFSKMISKPMVTISFLQNKNGSFVNQATYSKMARGLFLNHMIVRKIDTLDEIKTISLDGYTFNESLSNETKIVFTR